jgi:small subunit ribosomal protein S6
MARPYEAVYIFDPGLEDSAVNERLQRFHSLLGNPADLQVEQWGRRQLAYPIGRKEQGYYVIARFNVEANVLPEYERALRLDDSLIRYLLTLHERELGAPELSEEQLAAAASVRRDTDDDEDEE